MALLQTIHLEHLPPGYDVHVALFRDVKNASFLHQQLLAGNVDFEYSFIDASVVSCPSSSSLSRTQPRCLLPHEGYICDITNHVILQNFTKNLGYSYNLLTTF